MYQFTVELSAELAFLIVLWLVACLAVIVMYGADVSMLQVGGVLLAVRVVVKLARAK